MKKKIILILLESLQTNSSRNGSDFSWRAQCTCVCVYSAVCWLQYRENKQNCINIFLGPFYHSHVSVSWFFPLLFQYSCFILNEKCRHCVTGKPKHQQHHQQQQCMHFTILRICCMRSYSVLFCLPFNSFIHSLSSFDFNCINAYTYVCLRCVCVYSAYGVII